MFKKLASAATHLAVLSALGLVMANAFCSVLAGQQPSHCAQDLFCLFNQEARSTAPSGIHKYSEDLIELIVFNPAGDDSVRQMANRLAGRLAAAEQAARAGNKKLVPEAAVVKAFNDLMPEIGAPPSMRASEASVHGFREHAASIKAFRALFSANRNGTNCYPGEAVFLLSLLLSDSGVLLEGNLDAAVTMMQWNGRQGASVTRIFSEDSTADGRLRLYLSNHNLSANMVLFDHLAGTLGI